MTRVWRVNLLSNLTVQPVSLALRTAARVVLTRVVTYVVMHATVTTPTSLTPSILLNVSHVIRSVPPAAWILLTKQPAVSVRPALPLCRQTKTALPVQVAVRLAPTHQTAGCLWPRAAPAWTDTLYNLRLTNATRVCKAVTHARMMTHYRPQCVLLASVTPVRRPSECLLQVTCRIQAQTPKHAKHARVGAQRAHLTARIPIVYRVLAT